MATVLAAKNAKCAPIRDALVQGAKHLRKFASDVVMGLEAIIVKYTLVRDVRVQSSKPPSEF